MQQDLLMKFSELELSSKGLIDGLKTEILKKQEESDLLQKEVEKSEENVHLLEERVKALENSMVEKEQLVVELKAREKQIDDQKAEVCFSAILNNCLVDGLVTSGLLFQVMASLADTETKLQEARKEYDHMLESKHSELSKHLKEISQRNDQVCFFSFTISTSKDHAYPCYFLDPSK